MISVVDLAEKPLTRNETPKNNVNLIDHQFHKAQIPKEVERLKNLEGWLYKKSPNVFHGFQRRWCVLQGKIFRFYESRDSTYPNGVFNFDQMSAKLIIDDSLPLFRYIFPHRA